MAGREKNEPGVSFFRVAVSHLYGRKIGREGIGINLQVRVCLCCVTRSIDGLHPDVVCPIGPQSEDETGVLCLEFFIEPDCPLLLPV